MWDYELAKPSHNPLCFSIGVVEYRISQFFGIGDNSFSRYSGQVLVAAETPVDRDHMHAGVLTGGEVDFGVSYVYAVFAWDLKHTQAFIHHVRSRLSFYTFFFTESKIKRIREHIVHKRLDSRIRFIGNYSGLNAAVT